MGFNKVQEIHCFVLFSQWVFLQ